MSFRPLNASVRARTWTTSSSPSFVRGPVRAVQTPTDSSLIPQTLKEMEEDGELKAYLADIASKGQAVLTKEERLKRQRTLDNLGLPSFQQVSKESGVSAYNRKEVKIFQLNIGLYCNQACSHCHVESSPLRKEMMDRATAEKCIELMKASSSVTTVDITGGAPELNEQFRFLVRGAREAGLEVLDRCNLTVLLEPGQEDLVVFLAENKVHVVASLPCYSESNVDEQRGRGVFERSITALQMLNAVGYGMPGSDLKLDLVYNPSGASLAPAQGPLEVAYRTQLRASNGIEFNNLLALNNMPIKRFADWLSKNGKMEEYMQTLVTSFNPGAGESVMCRDTLSVGWDGKLFDCDFNQQLAMGMTMPATSTGKVKDMEGRQVMTVNDLESLDVLAGKRILLDNHCFGCTAGTGSGCGGQIA